jgi:hypothetical protein
MIKFMTLAFSLTLPTALVAEGVVSVVNNGGPGPSALLVQASTNCIEDPDFDLMFRLVGENFADGSKALEFFNTYVAIGRDFAGMDEGEKGTFCKLFVRTMGGP